jgi:alpha-amylase/alpha-mannosidase (GH57 family)
MDRYICIHAHFYQPPRENPWLEAIEQQDSAYPFHDWNERITSECYAPNSAARILGPNGRIHHILSNYAHISFNFGPTLLSWMEEKAPNIYQRILDSDTQSAERFSGHGNAIAQAYNHMILPLANRADKQTQVIWGIRDFEKRFGRHPEGMWLPEAAADVESLEVLADQGIKFTILAPHQAGQVRKLGPGGRWRNVEGGQIDPTRGYLCKLPSGKHINLFFYDGPISRAVAFEGLLSNGETFANRLLSGFSNSRNWPQLMHIATDGETYGHHHRHGEMALAYALHYIESNNLATITNYGEYLEKHPATHEIEIVNNTSWSCAHGIERWRSNCGCNSGMKPGWTQDWRAPLRSALDQLRDGLAQPYEEAAARLLKNPSKARDRYVDVILDRSKPSLDRFFAEHQAHELTQQERVSTLKLLEMQRHAMLMYTSCGWFFDELSGIETVQVIMYAGRALQLAQEIFGNGFEQHFLQALAKAHSNLRELGNGADIYERSVKPAQVDLLSVGAHYAIASLFDGYAAHSSIYAYDVSLKQHEQRAAGRTRAAVGTAVICSRITLESGDITFGVLHFGDHNVNAGVRYFRGEEAYDALRQDTEQAYLDGDIAAVLRAFDKHFDNTTYNLKSLFRDEQRRIVDTVLRSTLNEADTAYRQIYEHHASLMQFLASIHAPLPYILRVTAEFVLNSRLRSAFSADVLNIGEIQDLLGTVRREAIELDSTGLAFVLKKTINRIGEDLESNLTLDSLARFDEALSLLKMIPFEVDLWRAQNMFFDLLQRAPQIPDFQNEQAQRHLLSIGERLGLYVGVFQDAPLQNDATEPAQAVA